jgi:hypothetical protein
MVSLAGGKCSDLGDVGSRIRELLAAFRKRGLLVSADAEPLA